MSTGDSTVDDAIDNVEDLYDETVDAATKFFQKNPWVLGIILVVIGPLISTQGVRCFPYAVGGITGLGTWYLLFSLCVTFGWTVSATGWWVSLILTIIGGVIAASVIRRKIWIAVSALGAFGGACAGILLFDIIAVPSGWGPEWWWWTIVIISAMVGCFAALKLGKPVINITTSFIGAYLFTYGLTLFFWDEYWPSKEEIDNGTFQSSAW